MRKGVENMQFLIKWEIDVEIGGARAPVLCDARFGMALDDQPTACFLGHSEPIRYIESGQTDTESVGVFDRHHGKLKLF